MQADPELRKRQVYGLALLALALLLAGLARAARHTVFPVGWWRLW
jgi:hypothetical protein